MKTILPDGTFGEEKEKKKKKHKKKDKKKKTKKNKKKNNVKYVGKKTLFDSLKVKINSDIDVNPELVKSISDGLSEVIETIKK